MSTLKTASVLAFERKLDISDAFFWQANSQDTNSKPQPIKITEKSVRGTISNRQKKALANDPAKLDAETENANLQTVDAAALNHDNDTLIVKWSCKVLPFEGKPNVCNDQAYQAALQNVVQNYLDEHGVKELARRYAINIINARWLWRNRVGAEHIELNITCDKKTIHIADAMNYSLKDFDQNDNQITELASLIEAGLNGGEFIILYVEAKAKVGYGQEVYPSQELVLNPTGKKRKFLYDVNDQGGMHSQKISNAIRTIDTWYPNPEFPIAIEPYGAVTTLGTAFRQPKQKQDFYSLFDNWVLKDQKPEEDQQHYVMGVLIRGGVFGESGKE